MIRTARSVASTFTTCAVLALFCRHSALRFPQPPPTTPLCVPRGNTFAPPCLCSLCGHAIAPCIPALSCLVPLRAICRRTAQDAKPPPATPRGCTSYQRDSMPNPTSFNKTTTAANSSAPVAATRSRTGSRRRQLQLGLPAATAATCGRHVRINRVHCLPCSCRPRGRVCILIPASRCTGHTWTSTLR